MGAYRFGDKDYGANSRRPAHGSFYTAPLTGRPCTSIKEARLDGFCVTDKQKAQTMKCPNCDGQPKKYKSFYKIDCPTCKGRGRI